MDAYLSRFDRRIEEEFEFNLQTVPEAPVLGLWTPTCLRAEVRRLVGLRAR